MRTFHFGAGPALMAPPVYEFLWDQAQDAHEGTFPTAFDESHRGEKFVTNAQELEATVRRLLKVPEDFAVLFLQGGASTQFFNLPMLFYRNHSAENLAYIDTGTWSSKAIDEARVVSSLETGSRDVNILFSGKDEGYARIPTTEELALPNEPTAFVHYTGNNTIAGTEFHKDPMPEWHSLVGDLSSNIFSRPVDWSRHLAVYAGAQKNAGMPGATLVIIRKDLIQERCVGMPLPLDYHSQWKKKSALNTPCTIAWTSMLVNLRWLEHQGGVEAALEQNTAKADLLYDALDTINTFVPVVSDVESRSLMNVTFKLTDEGRTEEFLKKAMAAGLHGLKGHRSVGGCRASLYNAMPYEGVEHLVEFMNSF